MVPSAEQASRDLGTDMSNIPVKLIYVKFIDEIRTCMGPQSIQIIVMQSCRGGTLSLPHPRDCRPEKSRSLPPSRPPPSFAPSAAGGVACGLPTSGSFRIRGYRPPPSLPWARSSSHPAPSPWRQRATECRSRHTMVHGPKCYSQSDGFPADSTSNHMLPCVRHCRVGLLDSQEQVWQELLSNDAFNLLLHESGWGPIRRRCTLLMASIIREDKSCRCGFRFEQRSAHRP